MPPPTRLSANVPLCGADQLLLHEKTRQTLHLSTRRFCSDNRDHLSEWGYSMQSCIAMTLQKTRLSVAGLSALMRHV